MISPRVRGRVPGSGYPHLALCKILTSRTVAIGCVNASTPEVSVLELVEAPRLCDHVTGSKPATVPLRPGQPGRRVRDDRWGVDVNTDVEHGL